MLCDFFPYVCYARYDDVKINVIMYGFVTIFDSLNIRLITRTDVLQTYELSYIQYSWLIDSPFIFIIHHFR